MKSFLTWLVAFAFCNIASVSNAAMGKIDKDNDFPYVVEISAEWDNEVVSVCSAFVGPVGLRYVVMTAAHCVWKPILGLAKRVLTKFRDTDGNDHLVKSKRIIIPDSYPAAHLLVYPPSGDRSAENEKWWADDLKRAMLDLAFIVPDGLIQTDGYAHWITELISGYHSNHDENNPRAWNESIYDTMAHESGCDVFKGPIGSPQKPCEYIWSKRAKQKLNDRIEKELGDLSKVSTVIVGFGGFDCDSYEGASCKTDGKRRYAEVALTPSLTFEKTKFEAPWIWCSGNVSEGSNPIRHGDSGGPMFVRALDGRWLFVGYVSTGGRWGCSSSILTDIGFWRSVEDQVVHDMPDFFGRANEWNGAKSWAQHQSLRLLADILSSWSSSNKTDVWKSYYSIDGVNYYGTYSLEYNDVIKLKQRVFDKFSSRTFQVQPGSVSVNCRDVIAGMIQSCAVYAKVLIDLSNTVSGSHYKDTAELAFHFTLSPDDPNASITVDAEWGRIVTTSGPAVISQGSLSERLRLVRSEAQKYRELLATELGSPSDIKPVRTGPKITPRSEAAELLKIVMNCNLLPKVTSDDEASGPRSIYIYKGTETRFVADKTYGADSPTYSFQFSDILSVGLRDEVATITCKANRKCIKRQDAYSHYTKQTNLTSADFDFCAKERALDAALAVRSLIHANEAQ
jgi:hypothetical protein